MIGKVEKYLYNEIMQKGAIHITLIDPEKLTEGDWIVDDIIVDKKRIAGPKDLGIEKHQIKQLLKYKKLGKIKKIKVKYGIPFVPSFLLALIYTIIFNELITDIEINDYDLVFNESDHPGVEIIDMRP